jgi:protoheme ferro-lyase
MRPDFANLMPMIAAEGGRSLLIVPVQFLADHMETLTTSTSEPASRPSDTD